MCNSFFVSLRLKSKASLQQTLTPTTMTYCMRPNFLALLLTALCLAACKKNQTDPYYNECMQLMQTVQDSVKAGQIEWALQQTDSLQAIAPDSNYYQLWNIVKAKVFFAKMNVDSFIKYNTTVASFLQRNPANNNSNTSQARQLLQAEWLMGRGAYFASMTAQMDSAIEYNLKAVKTIERAGIGVDRRVLALANLADCYRQNGQPDKSTIAYMKALELADSANMQPETYIIIYEGISTTYQCMHNFEESNKWWEKTKELMPQMNHTDKFFYYNNRGNDFYLQQKYKQALSCFLTIDSMLAEMPDADWERAFAHANLADVYVHLGETNKAWPYINETEQFFKKVGYDVPLFYLQTIKIDIARREGRLKEATALINSNPIPQGMLPDQALLRLKQMVLVHEATGNYQAALASERMLNHITDSINLQNERLQLSTQLMQHENDKVIMEKEQQLYSHKMRLRLSAVIVLLSMLAVALMIIGWRSNMRRQKYKNLLTHQQIVRLRMDNIRNRITPHFIYNALNHEMLAQMHGHPVHLESLTQLLRRGVEQADMLQTTLKDELEFVEYYVNIEAQAMGSDFEFITDIAPEVDTKAVKLPSMTVQIFAENAIKHGLRGFKTPNGEKRQLRIEVTRRNNNTLVELFDNGRGMQNKENKELKTGMKVIRQTIQMLNENNHGQIDFGLESRSDGRGCRAWLLLPDNYDYSIISPDKKTYK